MSAPKYYIPSELTEGPLGRAIGECWEQCKEAGGYDNIEGLTIFVEQLRALRRFAAAADGIHCSLWMGQTLCKTVIILEKLKEKKKTA